MQDDQIRRSIEAMYDEKSPLDIKLIQTVLEGLDQGRYRVAQKVGQTWQVNEWLKKAILLYFKTHGSVLMQASAPAFDKIPLKFRDYSEADFAVHNQRVVPGAIVRFAAYLGSDVVLMPSFVNMGAYVGSGSMIDTWATIGSCAQIGQNVHISGGVGIGGVLEPLQSSPTIIEDNCFIGARSEIVEGVVVEEGSVIAMGVYISQSTKIYDVACDRVLYGRVPAGSVVVPGSLPAASGKYHTQAAIIVKRVDARTRAKVGVNALLRQAATHVEQTER
jgi:2,3,4,5-tetrahydropyridine-2,6-dicarboxylate N-succinyltransferase